MSAEPDRTHQKPAFLKRVSIRNYKSIKFCDVELEPLTVLVGRNGSGKSNFVDALGFLRDVVTGGVEAAIDLHGARNRMLFGGETTGVMRFEVTRVQPATPAYPQATTQYSISIVFPQDGAPRIEGESGQITNLVDGTEQLLKWFNANHEPRQTTVGFAGPGWGVSTTQPPRGSGRVVLASLDNDGFADFERRLSRLRTYNFSPYEFRLPTEAKPDYYLDPRGVHLASVITTTQKRDPWLIERVSQYLKVITETVQFNRVLPLVSHETMEFRVNASGKSFDLTAASMSDGTLRALAALVAVFQETYSGPPSLVAIEEPETSLHPAASAALVDALDEATGRTQVLITTHSTELLDNETIRPDNIRVVEMVDGETTLAKLDEASYEIIRRRLDTLGGLERQNQLGTDFDDVERQGKLAATAPGEAA